MTKQNRNSLKHGAFSEELILPGEDRAEFDELHRSLIDEWQPTGPVELDAVATLARLIWRKRRIALFQRNAMQRARQRAAAAERRRELLDERISLMRTAVEEFKVHSGPMTEEQFDEFFFKLPSACVDEALREAHLRQLDLKEDPNERITAIMMTIKLNIIPLYESRCHQAKNESEIIEPVRIDEILGEDHLIRELALHERIDAMIGRVTKRLMQTKAFKELISTDQATSSIGPEHLRQRKRVRLVEHRGAQNAEQ
jgi:hypothetical protein